MKAHSKGWSSKFFPLYSLRVLTPAVRDFHTISEIARVKEEEEKKKKNKKGEELWSKKVKKKKNKNKSRESEIFCIFKVGKSSETPTHKENWCPTIFICVYIHTHTYMYKI